MEDILSRASQLLQSGEPEQALLLLNEQHNSTSECEQLKSVCKRMLSQQYLYLLREAKNEEDTKTITEIMEKYTLLIGKDESLAQYRDFVTIKMTEVAAAKNTKGGEKNYKKVYQIIVGAVLIVFFIALICFLPRILNNNGGKYTRIIKKAYKTEMGYKDFLLIPEIKEFIIESKSRRFYDLALAYANNMPIEKDENGFFYVHSVAKESGCGTEFMYNDAFEIKLYYTGEEMTKEGEFNISPWEKGYYEGANNEADMSKPCYFYMRSFMHTESGIVENVEFRIDSYGLRLINWKKSDFIQASLRIEIPEEGEWDVPVEFSKGVIRLGWESEVTATLINFLSSKNMNIFIDYKDTANQVQSYYTPFMAMKQIYLATIDYMVVNDAINKISPNN